VVLADTFLDLQSITEPGQWAYGPPEPQNFVGIAFLRAGMPLVIRPRSRHRSLRQVAGTRLSLGFVNPATSSGSVPLTVTYQQPR
jgi:hypothetical protein